MVPRQNADPTRCAHHEESIQGHLQALHCARGMRADVEAMIAWICGYVVLVIGGVICIRACHSEPHGVRGRWRDLWRQLRYRPRTLPCAVANRVGQPNRKHSR